MSKGPVGRRSDPASGHSLGTVLVEDKSNEIPAAHALLDHNLSTRSAWHCRMAIGWRDRAEFTEAVACSRGRLSHLIAQARCWLPEIRGGRPRSDSSPVRVPEVMAGRAAVPSPFATANRIGDLGCGSVVSGSARWPNQHSPQDHERRMSVTPVRATAIAAIPAPFGSNSRPPTQPL